MKTNWKLVCGIIFFILPKVWATGTQWDEAWHLVRQSDGVQLWQLKGNARVLGTLRSAQRERPLEGGPPRHFFENFARHKRETLALINITQWQAEKHTWTKEGGHHKLAIWGHYLDYKRQKIAFVEHHFFGRQQTHQILMTYPASVSMTQSDIDDFMKGAKGKLIQ